MPGGKNKNRKVQPYAVFVSEEAKRLGISTQEAFDRCGETWKNMTDDERQRYVHLRNFNAFTCSTLYYVQRLLTYVFLEKSDVRKKGT